MSRYGRKIGAGIAILLGALLTMYPFISNFLYDRQVDSRVDGYLEEVLQVEEEELARCLEAAQTYNRSLSAAGVRVIDPFDDASTDGAAEYEDLLSMDDSGIMGFLEIPKIDVYLPIYHGTGEAVLQKGIGHIEGTSLPVGGESTHTVLSGHTGINASKMLTDLTDLEEGDIFLLHVLGETLAYQVCRVQVVLPERTDVLEIETGRDLASLLTCTPYGINSHRLVVTGERIPYTEEVQEMLDQEESAGTSLWQSSYLKALGMGIVCMMILFALVWVIQRVRRKRRRSGKKTAGKQKA